jgi:hypothetical protein
VRYSPGDRDATKLCRSPWKGGFAISGFGRRPPHALFLVAFDRYYAAEVEHHAGGGTIRVTIALSAAFSLVHNRSKVGAQQAEILRG